MLPRGEFGESTSEREILSVLNRIREGKGKGDTTLSEPRSLKSEHNANRYFNSYSSRRLARKGSQGVRQHLSAIDVSLGERLF